MENQNDTAENQTASKSIVPETSTGKLKIWIFRVACLLLLAAGVVFLIVLSDKEERFISKSNWDLVRTVVFAAMFIIAVCFSVKLTKFTAVRLAAFVIAVLMMAAGWYIYFRYIPKYGPRTACAIVKSDPEYASVTVQPLHVPAYDPYGNEIACPPALYEIEGNPFSEWGILLNVISDGKVISWLKFDPATGKYEVTEPKELTQISSEELIYGKPN